MRSVAGPRRPFETIDRALRLQPGNALAWEVKGQILESTNRLAEALTAFTRRSNWRRPAPTWETRVTGEHR